ncbi:MAG: hypothetical protein KDD99_27775, partial [Bacteroidetes bacterium]|nr:hypothetical protein [Bacteroidota bacterium]
MNRPGSIILIYFLSTFVQGFSQEVPRTINLSPVSRQALDKTWMIAQDEKHIMHFANTDGLVTYDGAQWNTFPLPNQQIARSVAIDEEGRIFIGGYGEFGYWERDKDGQLVYYSLSAGIDYNLAHSEEIWNIIVQPGYVLLQSFSTIYHYDYQKLSVIAPPDDQTIMFIHDVRGENYLQVREKGLYEILGGTSFQFLPGSESLSDKEVVCILPYKESGLLIGTSLNGIFIWENNTLTPWNTSANSLFIENQLNKGFQLDNGSYAFGTILNGVYILYENGNIQWNINRESGLQNNTVLSMWEDSQNNLWLGLDQGIDLIELNASLTFFPDFDGFMGTIYAAVIFEDYLYLGSNHGVYRSHWKKKGGTREPFVFLPGSQGQVWELKVFDNQLICGHNEGTFHIRVEQLKQISTVTGGWITLPCPNKPDYLIQGTYTGLVILGKNNRGEWEFSHRIPELRDPICKIVFDTDEYIWALNPYKGLYRLKMDDSLAHIQDLKVIKAEDGLPSEFNLDLVKIDNKVIIRSGKQFFTFDNASDKLVEIDSIQEFPILPDEFALIPGKDDEWFKVSPGAVTFIQNQQTEKIAVSQASNISSIIPLNQEYYLMGLSAGYALYRKEDTNSAEEQTRINPFITQVCLVGETEPVFCQNPVFSEENTLVLNHDQNYLRFSFAYPNYTHH